MAWNKSIRTESLPRLSTALVNNDISDNYSDKHVLKLLDSINVRSLRASKEPNYQQPFTSQET